MNLAPKFESDIEHLIQTCLVRGLNVGIFCGYRSIKDQDKLYALGRTVPNKDGIVTNSKGGQSWHNWGLAADIVFKTPNWNWNPELNWARLGKIGKSFGLEWGGDWLNMPDLPHFQYRNGLTILEAIKIGDISKVWDIVYGGKI